MRVVKWLLLAVAIYSQPLAITDARAQGRTNHDYCSKSGQVRLFLVDITTQYDQTDKDSIVGMIDKVLSESAGGDLIVVRTIADSYTKSERLIERCVPQCPVQGFVNRLFKCSDGLIRTDTIAVRANILQVLKARLETFDELKFSDIIRTVDNDVKEESRDGQLLDLYLYSDLIENSDDLISEKKFFKYPIPFLVSALGRFGLIAPLPKSQVEVAGVGRADTTDRRPLTITEQNFLKGFWEAYFKAGGASKVSISEHASAE